MSIPTEIAQLPTIDTVQSTTRLLVQDGVTGTPYQQTTVGKIFLDLIDQIGTSTIIDGDVIISGGTASLDQLIATSGTITDATIIGGTGTFATGSIATLAVPGTLTAGLAAITAINAGTVDISSGKATLATAVVTTGTVGTLTSTTGTIATLNAGTITIGTGTGTLTALNVTGTLDVGVGNVTTANIGTVDISSGTAALQTLTAESATITALSAPTLAVSGTATVGHVSATSVTASGAIVGASGTITTVNAGTVAVAGNVSAATGTITDLASTTLAATGTATIGHAAATSATVGTLVASAGTVTLESATITDAVVSKGTIATLIANAGTVSLSKGTITDLTTTTLAATGTATIGTAAFGTSTVAKADPRWGLVDGVTTDKDGYPLGYFGPDGTFYAGAINSGGGNSSSEIVTTDTLVVAGSTVTAADPRWGLLSGLDVDASGYPMVFELPSGERIIEAQTVNTLTLGNEPTASSHAATKKYVDEAAGGTSGAYTGIELQARDAAALAQSMAIRDATNATIATPAWMWSHIIHYGQSFAGAFGATLISTTAGPDGVSSFGARPSNTVQTDEFVQSGTASIQDLTISAGSEVPAIGMANYLRRGQLSSANLLADTTRQLLINCAFKGGTALEDLSKGATPTEYYAQIPDLMDKSHTAAGSDPYGVAAFCLLQGEANYSLSGSEHTEAGYKALLEAIATDMAADAITETSQTYPPALFLCQTSSAWDAYAGDISSIGNAQLYGALENPNIYLVGPYYAYPDDGTNHLTSDGYRWLGEQFGKVLHKVLIQGAGWEPCHIKAAWFRGDKVLLEYHVPYPPLQVQAAYIETTLTTFDNRGYRIGDDAGAISITSVEVNAATVVITMARETSTAANPWIQYAGLATYSGAGNICDSDPTVSYSVDTGTSEPYPLWNWAVGQRIDIVEDV